MKTFASKLRASAAEVFRHATSLDGINRELWPLRMTAPAGLRSFADAGTRFPNGVPTNEVLFTSYVCLGPIPFDRMRIKLAELDLPKRRFVETSDVLSMRVWRHEREVIDLGASSCELIDSLRFEARARFANPLIDRIIGHIFPRRHAVLRKLFGEM